VFVVVVCVVVVFVVCVVVVVVISSLLRCEGFWGYIVRMLAARAARSMRGGGGSREMKVLWVLGAVVMFDDGRGVVGGSWSTKCRPLKFAAVVCTVLRVPGSGGGEMREATRCSLSSSSNGLSH